MAASFSFEKSVVVTPAEIRKRAKAVINSINAFNEIRKKVVEKLTDSLAEAKDFNGVLKEPFELNGIQRVTALKETSKGVDLVMEVYDGKKKNWVEKSKALKFSETEEIAFLLIKGVVPDEENSEVSLMDFLEAYMKWEAKQQ